MKLRHLHVLARLLPLWLTVVILVVVPPPASATSFTANLKDYAGNAPNAFVRLELRGCTVGNTNFLPNVSGTGVFVGDDRGGTNIFPDSNGLVTGVTVQDQSTITCAGVQGLASSASTIYYHISIWSGSQSRPLARNKLAEGDFDIYGTSFDLNSAVAKITISPVSIGGNATALKGILLGAGTPTNGQGWFYSTITGKYELSAPSGGSGGSSVSVNGSPISSPNFNLTNPAAQTNFVNCTWQVSGTDISVECPQGTSGSTFAAGNDSRITLAVPNTTTVNGHALSANVTVTKSDVGLGSVDNTSDASKPISTATQTALDTKPTKPAGDCPNTTTNKVVYDQSTNQLTCATDQTSGSGTGITDINTLTATSQTMDVGTQDTNVQLAITQSSSSNNRWTITWASTLAKSRQNPFTVYNDQANTYSSGLQDFSGVTVKLPIAAGAAPATEGLIQVDSTSHTLEVGLNGVNKTVAMTDSNITGQAATALAASANPGNCSGSNFPKGVDASFVAEGCTAVLDSDLSTSDITTNNATSSKHGFLPRLSGVSTEFLNGTGAFSTPAGSGTVNASTQYSLPYYSASGTANTISGVAAATTPDGVPQFYVSTPAAGVATAPTLTLAGLGGRTISANDAFVATDRGKCVITSGSSAINITLPQAGSTGFGSNYYTCLKVEGTGAVTVTPSVSTINGGSSFSPNRGERCVLHSIDNSSYRVDCGAGQITFTGDMNAVRSAFGIQIGLNGTIGSSTTGNAATATALAANGSNCSTSGGAQLYPLGITAAGASEGCQQVADADLTTSDITTNNTSITKHGFAPKLDNNSAHFLDGTGAWSTPSVASAPSLSISGQTGLLSFTGLTTVNRVKTIRDAADTILELGGSYTPTGTWTWTSCSGCTWPTFNQNTTGSAASVSVSGQTGLITFTGITSTNRAKTVRDAADTILELGGSYTPTGTWTNMTLVTPALGTPSAAVLTNATGLPAASVLSGALANGMTATTQSAGSNDTKVATDAYVDGKVSYTNTTNTMSSIGTSTGTGLRLTGSSLTAGNAYYMQSGGTLAAANAGVSSTMPALCLADSTTTCIYSGIYRFSASQSWTVGGKIYISTSAGALTQTAPSSTGQQVQCFGVALANDTILIKNCDTAGIQ